jgi:hypothetical protein
MLGVGAIPALIQLIGILFVFVIFYTFFRCNFFGS